MQTPTGMYQKLVVMKLPRRSSTPTAMIGGRSRIDLLHQDKVFISNAFEGYHLGLEIQAKDTYGVWFDHLGIGKIDLTSFKFKAVAIEELNQ